MKFKCPDCGSNHYELFRGASHNYATYEPSFINMDDGTSVWWVAECEGCHKKWGNYTNRKILTEVMVEAEVLK